MDKKTEEFWKKDAEEMGKLELFVKRFVIFYISVIVLPMVALVVYAICTTPW